ncbi:hypothetical protein SASPL_148367 [Salvia splendens]|uniref:PTC1-like winged helix-turn-helix domain-containing protein n=1 Tax=Salvia splendens TaxID=180675 RepID=A0A8X8Z478_SALSN|nr:hypothetical protein SASPL_148367 [Salvia splendens]
MSNASNASSPPLPKDVPLGRHARRRVEPHCGARWWRLESLLANENESAMHAYDGDRDLLQETLKESPSALHGSLSLSLVLSEMDQKDAVQGSVAAAEPRCTPLLQDSQFLIGGGGDKSPIENYMKEGYLYEIYHAQLPPRTPAHLRSIRVCEKTEVNVAVRYPSMESLKAFFNYSLRESHPSLDEKFVMGSALAARVLVRRVPAEIFMEQKSWIDFWVIAQRKGSSCLSEALKGSGMVTWGIRRQVKYLGRHKESDDNNDAYIAQNSSSSFVNGGGKKSRGSLVQRDPKDRWSTQRYKLAEQNLLEVMKSKGATAEKPILRPQLRAEARKRIGDTGLLDHLLKHMAGKLAPGGQERFRRRHNPDGAMEYWLECANLVKIRKDAGVTDPYWVPPPGWKLGDSPTQDPICARELKLLRGDVSKIKRSLELMATKMQLEEEVGKLRREIGEIHYKKKQQGQSFTEESNKYDISQKLDQLTASFESLKRDFSSMHLSEEKYKEQLMTISDFVKDIEGKFEKLAPNVTETAKTGSSLMIMGMREKTALESKEEQVQDALSAGGEGKKLQLEEKAAKIERLKSGFRICKPQGTFLWPNNNSTSSVKVQVEYKVSANRPTLESGGGGYTETATSCSEVGSWLALSTTLKSDSSHG